MALDYPFISSRQHPLVQACRELVVRHAEGRALVDGEHLVAEAVGARVPLELLLVDAAHLDRSATLHALLAEARARGTEVVTAAGTVLDAASPVRSPSRVVAIARIGPAPLERALTPPALLLVASGVQDPGNLGAMVRAADAFGATGVVATRGSAWPFGWKALRGAMGSAFRLPIAIADDETGLARTLGSAGLLNVAALPDGGVTPDRVDLCRPVAIWLGAEGQGLAPAAAGTADLRVRIAMREGVDSLNVSTAAAVLLYEARRQRTAAARPA